MHSTPGGHAEPIAGAEGGHAPASFGLPAEPPTDAPPVLVCPDGPPTCAPPLPPLPPLPYPPDAAPPTPALPAEGPPSRFAFDELSKFPPQPTIVTKATASAMRLLKKRCMLAHPGTGREKARTKQRACQVMM